VYIFRDILLLDQLAPLPASATAKPSVMGYGDLLPANVHVGPVELDALQENLSNDIFAENLNCHCLQLPERSITVCSLSNSWILHSCSYDCDYFNDNVMVLLDCRLDMGFKICCYLFDNQPAPRTRFDLFL
ncbi:hypothetical protein HID58_028293, partial [Brassica napus]